MRASRLLHFLLEDGPQVALGRDDVQADAQPLPVEVGQVVEEHSHPRSAPDEQAGRRGDRLSRVQVLQVMRRELDCVERVSHVVAEDSQQQIARPLLLRAEERNRFADGLVDGLVEAKHVGEIRPVGIAGVDPQPEHRCTQCAVLRGHVVDVEAGTSAQQSMRLRRGLGGTDGYRRPFPLRSLASVVCGDAMSLQTAPRICSAWSRSSATLIERALGSAPAKVSHRSRDLLHVPEDEVCEPHAYSGDGHCKRCSQGGLRMYPSAQRHGCSNRWRARAPEATVRRRLPPLRIRSTRRACPRPAARCCRGSRRRSRPSRRTGRWS